MPVNHRFTTGSRGAWIAVLLLLLAGRQALAACNVIATGVSFGVIDPLVVVDHASTGSVTVSCDTLTSYSIALGPGAGTYGQREMTGTAGVLQYNLYDSSVRDRVWGDGSGTTVTVNGSADSGGRTHTVYGQVPYQPTAVPGSYSDTITVTVSY